MSEVNFDQEMRAFNENRAIYDGIPADNLLALGAKNWKATRNKGGYFRLMNSVLKPSRGDLAIAGDEEFRSAMYGNLQSFQREISLFYRPSILKKYNALEELQSKIYTSKSDFVPVNLFTTVNEYLLKTEARKEVLPDEKYIRNFYFSHLKGVYENSLSELIRMPSEEQAELILAGVQGNTNIGYDLFTKQSKRTFATVFVDYASHHLGIKVDFDAQGILETVSKALERKHFPPFVQFYRTQGGTSTKTRAVFGGGILAKGVGALLVALKGMGKSLKAIGDWNWIAWDNWDVMFDRIRKTHEDTDNIIVGEDFSGYDQSILAEDLDFVKDYDGKLRDILRWTWNLLKESKVWAGKARIKDIIFKSGHPFTSEFGSIVHYLLSYLSAKDNGWKIKSGVFLSDDNLVHWDNFRFSEHQTVMDRYGFVMSEEKSSDYIRDGFSEFLKNQTGYINNTEATITVGNPVSRYIGFAHVEREGDTRGLYEITGDNGVDQIISKLGSFGSSGLPFVNNILKGMERTRLGRKVFNGLQLLQTGDLEIESAREDFEISFAPTWLRSANLFLGK